MITVIVLRWYYYFPEVVLELLLAWNRLRCRPPLDDAEVAQVVNNIVRLHLSESGTPNDLAEAPARWARGH